MFAGIAGITLATCGSVFAEAQVEMAVNRNQIYLGEPFILQIKITNADKFDEPDISAIKGAAVKAYAPQSQSFHSVTMVNGRTQRQSTSTTVYTYEITPESEGKFTAGPVSIVVDGKKISRPAETIEVLGVQKQDWVQIRIETSKESVILDEPFDVTMTVSLKQLPAPHTGVDPIVPQDPPVLTVPFLVSTQIDGLDGPDLQRTLSACLVRRNDPGFSINSMADNSMPDIFNMDPGEMFAGFGRPKLLKFMFDRRNVTNNGIACIAYSLKLRYKANKEGNYTFGPVQYKGNAVTAADSQGRATTQQIWAVGPARTVRVVPPPDQGRPPSYIGAIGSNIVVDATLDAQTCNVGDPLTLTLTIGGDIRLSNVYPPDLANQKNISKDFRVNDDSLQISTKDRIRTYKWTVRPKRPGTLELPPIEVTYFDFNERAYRTVKTRPIPVFANDAVIVDPSMIISSATNNTESAQGEERGKTLLAPLDIDPAGVELPPPLLSNWHVVALSSGPALFILVISARLLLRYGRHRAAVLRRANAAQKATDRLKRARSAALPPESLCRDICGAFGDFLSERFDLPHGSVTPGDAASILRVHDIPEDLLERFHSVFERNFNAVFSGQKTITHDVIADLDAAIGILHEFDARSTRPPNGTVRIAMPLLIFMAVCHAALADNLQERQFIWEEANSRMISARSQDDYLRAFRSYEKLLKLGARNGPLFYNMGTALLQAGQHDEAIRMFERAERYTGASEDIAQNMLSAIAAKEKSRQVALPWTRTFFFWHHGISMSTRVGIAVIAFTVLWIALTLRTLGVRNFSKELIVISLVVLIAFGSSVVTSIQQEQRDEFRGTRLVQLATTGNVAPAAASDRKEETNVRKTDNK